MCLVSSQLYHGKTYRKLFSCKKFVYLLYIKCVSTPSYLCLDSVILFTIVYLPWKENQVRNCLGKSCFTMQSNYDQENKVRFHINYNFLGNYGVEFHNSFLFKVKSVGIFFNMLKYLFVRFCLSKYLFAQYLKSECWQAITIQQWKIKPQDGCFPSLPSVTAFNFHLFDSTVLVYKCFLLLSFIQLTHKI